MAFTEQHKVFMVMTYFRNGVKIDGVWQYSLALCMEEFGEEFPDIAVKYTQFRQTLNISLKNFQEDRSVGRKPGSSRSKKRTPEVIEETRQAMEEAPGTFITTTWCVCWYLSFNCEKKSSPIPLPSHICSRITSS
jgi:hypothetical protein